MANIKKPKAKEPKAKQPDTAQQNINKWILAFPEASVKTEYDAYFKKYPKQKHVKLSFETEVTENPFFHSADLRIVPLKGENLRGQYRYGKSDTRIVYYPDQQSHTVFPLETCKITDPSYKRKSRKK